MTNALYWHTPEPAAVPPPGDKLRLDRPMPPALENGMADETSAAEVRAEDDIAALSYYDEPVHDNCQLAYAFARHVAPFRAENDRLRAEVKETQTALEEQVQSSLQFREEVDVIIAARDAAEARAEGLAEALRAVLPYTEAEQLAEAAAVRCGSTRDPINKAVLKARAALAQHSGEKRV